MFGGERGGAVAALEKVRERAITSLREGRERAYLERIKKRHQRVLLRYRELATAPEDLEDLDYRESRSVAAAGPRSL